MMTMTATIADVQNDVQKYIASMMDGYEVIVTDNGKEIGKFIPRGKSDTPLTDSLAGILKGAGSLEEIREKYLRKKYEIDD